MNMMMIMMLMMMIQSLYQHESAENEKSCVWKITDITSDF